MLCRAEANGSPLFANTNASSLTAISESGLYKLIMRSDKDEAVTFQNWVTREVLPSIRKTGKYALADHGREAMPLPIDIAEAFGRALPDAKEAPPKAKRR